MPELPEVETVRRILENKVNNKKIIKIEILHDKLLRNIEKKDF
ncbi:MAG: DNA-formamidopyrimidine glycosylase, partial [Mycoplasmataceae bacterium]|nr:DNA-formamidopyrimidine glycosylase [Mycoplasmataceae bacterium]